MTRKSRPWKKRAARSARQLPDAEVAELTACSFGTIWQKRRSLGIDQPALRFRKWTPAEDKLVGTATDAEIARQLGRTEIAAKSRRAVIERAQARRETRPVISDPKPSPAILKALGAHPIAYSSILRSKGIENPKQSRIREI